MTAYSDTHTRRRGSAELSPAAPELVLCATSQRLATAWSAVTDTMGPRVRLYSGPILHVDAAAVVSPANSYGWMRDGVDAIYTDTFPEIEQRVRSAVLAYHGGEMPVGEALAVPTGAARPQWLISAPVLREQDDQLRPETVQPYLAARAVFLLWRDGTLDNNQAARHAIDTIAMPGLGTELAGLDPEVCAHQVATAWQEVFPTDA